MALRTHEKTVRRWQNCRLSRVAGRIRWGKRPFLGWKSVPMREVREEVEYRSARLWPEGQFLSYCNYMT